MIKRFVLTIIFMLFFSGAVMAKVQVPEKIQNVLFSEFKSAQTKKFRFDGLLEIDGKLWLPFIPKEAQAPAAENIHLVLKSANNDYLFSNGWIYIPIINNTIRSFDFYDKDIQRQILQNTVIPNFIVPEGFTIPRDLAVTVGHLRIALRNVELATDREARYIELLKQENKNSDLRLIVYDNATGLMKQITILGGPNKSELEVDDLDEVNKDLSLISQLKKIDSEVYFSDYNTAKLYKIVEHSKRVVSDDDKHAMAKPNENKKIVETHSNFTLEELYSLEEKKGLKDFSFSPDLRLTYLLTNKDGLLHIHDSKTKKPIKDVAAGSNPNQVYAFSRGPNETDYAFVTAKSSNELTVLSSFDYRVFNRIKVGKLPVAVASSYDHIFVAHKDTSMLHVIDWVTFETVSQIPMDLVPYKMLFLPKQKNLLILGSQPNTKKASLLVFNTENFAPIKTIDLSPDLVDPKDFTVSRSGYFLVVGSSGSDTVGIVDLETLELIKKVEIGFKSSRLVAI